MFKKMITLILAFTVLTASAGEPEVRAVKEAFDELSYSLTVEWDQKDKTFYNQKMKEFHMKLITMQKEGLTTNDLLDFVRMSSGNSKLNQNLDQMVGIIEQSGMDVSEASKFLTQNIGQFYKKGASFKGDVSVGGIIVISAFVLAILAIVLPLKATQKAIGAEGDCVNFVYCEY